MASPYHYAFFCQSRRESTPAPVGSTEHLRYTSGQNTFHKPLDQTRQPSFFELLFYANQRLAFTVNNDKQRVWLILAKFRALADNPIGLTIGSEALVQCFVPETIIEVALNQADQALRGNGMMRTDVIKCVHFEGGMHQYDVPDFVKRDVEQARTKQKTVIGTFFTSQDTASFRSENDRVE